MSLYAKLPYSWSCYTQTWMHIKDNNFAGTDEEASL